MYFFYICLLVFIFIKSVTYQVTEKNKINKNLRKYVGFFQEWDS